MSTPPVRPVAAAHPVLVCAAALGDALDEVTQVEAGWMSAPDKRAALLVLTRVGAQVEELRLRVLAAGQELGDVAEADGSRDAAAWLSAHARLDSHRARHLGRLAVSLAERWPAVGAALRAGAMTPDQAQAVVAGLDELPEGLDPQVRRAAEARLVEQAAHFDPRRLRILARRVLDHVAPEVAEGHEAQALAREDAHARAVAFIRTRRRGDGTTDLTARLPDPAVSRLLTYLHAFTSPRRQSQAPRLAPSPGEPSPGQPWPGEPSPGEQSEEEVTAAPSGLREGVSPGAVPAPNDPPGAVAAAGARRPHDRQLADAFVSLLESIDSSRLPLHGGDATTVVVTVDLETLRDELGGSGVALVGDEPVTAGHARRLACSAAILPAVMGADSVVLDLGRSRRLYSPGQRKAIGLRHPICAAGGCDIPSAWCELHHAGLPWARGGRTDVADGVPLCSHHHNVAHDPRYETTRHPDGSIRFHRRT